MRTFACVGAYEQCKIESKEIYRMLSIKETYRVLEYAKETHQTHKRHPYAYVYILDLLNKSNISSKENHSIREGHPYAHAYISEPIEK